MKRRSVCSLLSLIAILKVSTAHATVLIFEPATGSFPNFGGLPQGYGDRVTATSQDGFLYSLDGGPTPNIVVHHSTDGLPQLYTWYSDFGDLQNVVFAQEPHVFELQLIADPGYSVRLNSFDMACWPHLDYVINDVEVLDGNGNQLFFEGPVTIQGDSNGPQHSSFVFQGVVGQVIRVRFDSTNQDSDDIGIDNINFSQVAQCPDAPDGDMNGDTVTDGVDIQLFVSAVLTASTNATDLCHGDFSLDSVMDAADAPQFVNALLLQ